jgi:hypothetical protein
MPYLAGRGQARKWRLFACACCRRIWHLLPQPRARAAVETAEAYADGFADPDQLHLAWTTVRKVRSTWPLHTKWEEALTVVLIAANPSITEREAEHAARSAGNAVWHVEREREGWAAVEPKQSPAMDAERAAQCVLLRDLCDPFHSVVVDPCWVRWNDGAVCQLARAIYVERRFEDLPILADALEEAGCTDGHLLAHCRSGGEHIRGCWAVDALLGKT